MRSIAYLPLVFALGCSQPQQERLPTQVDHIEARATYFSRQLDKSLFDLQQQANDSIAAGFERCFEFNKPGLGFRALEWGAQTYEKLRKAGEPIAREDVEDLQSWVSLCKGLQHRT